MTLNTALLVVDVQKSFDDQTWGGRNNPQAEKNIETLLQHARNAHWEVIHVQHHSTSLESSLHPSKPGCAFKECATPLAHEKVIHKHVNSAFIGTDF